MSTFGLEFEVAGISTSAASAALNRGGIECIEPNRTHETCESWKSVFDGSVRGAEIVSPILNDARLNEASTVARLLLSAGGKVDRSTGFHVHIGAAGLSSEHIAQFYLNWNRVHDAIGAMVAPSRLNNSYCKAVDAEHAERNASRIIAGNISDHQGNRYHSFNLMSYERHGTLEIRLHQGTLNGTKAVAWAKFIDAFKDFSQTQSIALDDLGINDRLNKCESLLNILMLAGNLDHKTGQYLKDRAATIQA
jgi:hypothetical protein